MSQPALDRGPLDPRTWLRDPWLLGALFVGLALRLFPLIFAEFECQRDECIYRNMAVDIIAGKGLTLAKKGWLPSPGYPYVLAWAKMTFGTMHAIIGFQIAASLASIALLYGIGREVGDRRTARIAAFLFAMNPTIAWFTNTLWIETFYIFLLLAAIVFMMASWRNEQWQSAAWSGLMMGTAILFRGVATYLPPFWLLAAIYPSDDPWSLEAWRRSAKARWRSALAFGVAVVLVVAPYSYYGSQKYGGFLVTDATVGHVLYLGNNDFPPLTFDYGNGMLTEPIYGKWLATGRRPCRRDVPPVLSSKCEVGETLAWIRQHPDRFVARIPMRIAQLLNPNSFLTRHVRWGYWPGFPSWAKEFLAVWIVVLSAALALVGTAGAWARARGPFAMMAVGTTLYTVMTIAVMYGMTRFRLPLEALWTVYLALFLADPRESLRALQSSQWRLAGVLLTLPPILALMSWYLPTGFPMFW